MGRLVTDERKELWWGSELLSQSCWMKVFSLESKKYFYEKRFNRQKASSNTWTCIDLREHMCVQFSVFILIQEWDCIAWVALELLSCLLTVLNKWSESPLLRGGWSETVCACVSICVCALVCSAPPWPCRFLRGFLSPYVSEVRGRVIIEHSLALLTNVLKGGIEKPVNEICLPRQRSGLLFL